jgi:hypothetical protein
VTEYDKLCQAYFELEPRQIAIDRMLRELPLEMRQAISDHLGVPQGAAPPPTMVSHISTAYVDLFWPVVDHRGQRTWKRCDPSDCLRTTADDVYAFCIGICIEKERGSPNASMVYFTFDVEEFDDHSIKLQIENLDGSIVIDNARDPASYAKAAAVATERIISFMKSSGKISGGRTPIGFVSPR